VIKTVQSDGRSIDQYIPRDLRRMFYQNTVPDYKYRRADGYDPYGFLTDGLVLYLPLWALKGASFKSVDAYQHACSVTGALWQPNGRYFGGEADNIDVGSAASLECPSFTFACWVKRYEAGVHHTLIADTYTSTAVKDHYINLRFTDTNVIGLYFGDGTNAGDASSTGKVADTNWHFIAVSRNDDTEKIQFVINSTAETAVNYGTSCGTLITLGTQTLKLGIASVSSYARPLKGYMGEAWLYNKPSFDGDLTVNSRAAHLRSMTSWRYQ